MAEPVPAAEPASVPAPAQPDPPVLAEPVAIAIEAPPPAGPMNGQDGAPERVEAPYGGSAEPSSGAAVSEAPEARVEEFLGFTLDAEEYCLWIRSVREIIRPTDITPIPRGPANIMGIISLRGSIVPIFDVRRRLSMPARDHDSKSRIVVVVIDGAPVGMVVDHVTEVINAEADALGPPPTTMGEREAGFVTATLRHRERLIGVLHLERLVAVDASSARAAA
ncbi:MAG: chemotaxis protein CheW [Nitrospirota bacterium]